MLRDGDLAHRRLTRDCLLLYAATRNPQHCFMKRWFLLLLYDPQQPQYQQYNRDHDQCMNCIPCRSSDSASTEKAEQPQDEQNYQDSFKHFLLLFFL